MWSRWPVGGTIPVPVPVPGIQAWMVLSPVPVTDPPHYPHYGSCLKFEKSGVTKAMVRGVPGSCVSPREFRSYWVQLSGGAIAVGTGAEPSLETLSYRWKDEDPTGPIQVR